MSMLFIFGFYLVVIGYLAKQAKKQKITMWWRILCSLVVAGSLDTWSLLIPGLIVICLFWLPVSKHVLEMWTKKPAPVNLPNQAVSEQPNGHFVALSGIQGLCIIPSLEMLQTMRHVNGYSWHNTRSTIGWILVPNIPPMPATPAPTAPAAPAPTQAPAAQPSPGIDPYV